MYYHHTAPSLGKVLNISSFFSMRYRVYDVYVQFICESNQKQSNKMEEYQ